jgi:hypothetical protein
MSPCAVMLPPKPPLEVTWLMKLAALMRLPLIAPPAWTAVVPTMVLPVASYRARPKSPTVVRMTPVIGPLAAMTLPRMLAAVTFAVIPCGADRIRSPSHPLNVIAWAIGCWVWIDAPSFGKLASEGDSRAATEGIGRLLIAWIVEVRPPATVTAACTRRLSAAWSANRTLRGSKLPPVASSRNRATLRAASNDNWNVPEACAIAVPAASILAASDDVAEAPETTFPFVSSAPKATPMTLAAATARYAPWSRTATTPSESFGRRTPPAPPESPKNACAPGLATVASRLPSTSMLWMPDGAPSLPSLPTESSRARSKPWLPLEIRPRSIGLFAGSALKTRMDTCGVAPDGS